MILRSLSLSLLFLASLHAAEDPKIVTLRAADDARVAAIVGADASRLAEILSDDLRYAHSTGSVDTKASFVDTLVSARTKYNSIQYTERNFSFPAPGIALVSGRAGVKVTLASGQIDAALSFLAVWREERGQWRFLAWQSCKIPTP
jgi:Domain of unknown function (DUF4440)